MALSAKLPKLSRFVIDSLAQMGFKQIDGRPYEFIGSIKSQDNDYGMAALLTVMPLKLQTDNFVISLDMNGEQMVKTRLAGLDDIANLVGYAGVTKQILDAVNRKENDDYSTKRGVGKSPNYSSN
jgi:hypothetical protein